ncbi:MAG: YraN family protein [Actinomycetota bacterium]|nr:YraN family protein [Actinomycetota bacterium]MDK1017138.1 YraN family protein [Actinomycetota bacterium]MDK1026999.1 YraN family protein [Actinomycetota bacterium]MDK1039329.1 YraN family protein [Actinomycetota bacterium]MDK1097467.1 YraN family protein [Actinomycetota bacterium]
MNSEKSKQVGAIGETIAVRFLHERGLRIVERNVFVDRDEIDIIYERDGEFVAVEVKTSSNDDDPLEAFDDVKMHRVRRAAAGWRVPIVEIDAIAVTLRRNGVEIRWLRGIA